MTDEQIRKLAEQKLLELTHRYAADLWETVTNKTAINLMIEMYKQGQKDHAENEFNVLTDALRVCAETRDRHKMMLEDAPKWVVVMTEDDLPTKEGDYHTKVGEYETNCVNSISDLRDMFLKGIYIEWLDEGGNK